MSRAFSPYRYSTYSPYDRPYYGRPWGYESRVYTEFVPRESRIIEYVPERVVEYLIKNI